MHVVDKTLRKSHCTVYEVLRQYVLIDGGSPSKQELARGAGLSLITVYQAEKALKEKGYVTSEKDAKRTMRPTNLDLTISHEELDPWSELEEPKLYWRMSK